MPTGIGLGLSPNLPDGARGTPWTPTELSSLRAWYDAELGQPKGVGYVQLDGTSGDYIYTPDAINVDQTGDLELVMRVYCNDWSNGANQTLACKYVTTGNQRSWRVYVSTTGQVALSASPDGTSAALATAIVTPSVALPDATWIWLRARLQLTNGANSVGTLDTAADTGSNSVLPVSWTANGLPSPAVPLAGIFSSTSPVEIGSFANGTLERLAGKVGRCIVRDGFDGRTVADFNASDCYGPGYLNQGSLPTDGGGARYVPLRGVSGDYVWTADKAALRITGDIDVAVDVALADWTPAAASTLIARWRAVVGNRAFAFRVFTSGVLQLLYSADGSTTLTASSTAAPVVADGGRLWVRATLDVDNGAGGHTITFFTSPDGSSWTQLGAPVVVAGTVSLWAAQESMSVGARDLGATEALAGRVYRAIVRNGIGGTVVADFNAEQATVFGQAADGYGNGWLIADPKHLGNWTLGLPKIYDRSGNGVAPATFGAGSNQPTWLPWDGTPSVYLPGASGNYVSCPDAAALDITGDIEIVARVRLSNWASPPAGSSWFINKHGLTTGGGYGFRVLNSGVFQLNWSTGAAGLSISSAAHGLTSGVTYWVKATLDVDNGASGNTVTFYWAADQANEPTSWTQIGSPVVTAGVTSIGVNTLAPTLGTWYSGTGGELDGRLYRVIVRSGIGGTTVADFDAGRCGQSGYTDAYSNAWAITRATSGRKAVVQSPVAASARSVILHGTDDYITVPAAAVPPMLAASNFEVNVVGRQWATTVVNGRWFDCRAASPFPGAVLSMGTGTQFSATLTDGTNSAGPTSINLTYGQRAIATMYATDAGQTFGIAHNAETPSTASAAAVGARTGSDGTIARTAPTASGYQDLEFEALVTRSGAGTVAERGLLTAYYKGGL